MIIKVPRLYASYLRNRRILFTSAIVVPCLFLSYLLRDYSVQYMLIGLSAISASSLFFLLVSYRHPLDYVISSDGISLRIQSSKSRLTGLHDSEAKIWLDWRTDPLTKVEITHWQQLPALLLRTDKHIGGRVVPFEKESMNQAQSFLEDVCRKRLP